MPLEKLVPKQIVTLGVSAVRSLVVFSLGSILVCPARRPGVGAGSLWTPRVCELGTEAATTGSSFIVVTRSFVQLVLIFDFNPAMAVLCFFSL